MKNAYEIRLNLLELSFNILVEQKSRCGDKASPITITEIIDTAKELSIFVSSR